MNHIIYTYEQFRVNINALAIQIQESNFQPDLIVGVLRGGAIPAIHLSHLLDCPVKIIEWSTRDSKTTDRKNLDKIAVMAERGQKILLVEDIVDSGKTLTEIKSRLFETRGNIRYAAMWYNIAQNVVVDFYSNTIDRTIDERWVYMPWEKQNG
jgi:uncharacterized protein